MDVPGDMPTLASVISRCLSYSPAQGGASRDPPTEEEVHASEDLTALTPAAVLVPLIEHAMTILLTIRTPHLRHHPGQISFPGGCVEPGDRDTVDTALRELHEEIGIASAYVEIVGCLDNYPTVTGFTIMPVVGIVKPGFELSLDTFEVAEVFEIPLEFAFDISNYERRQVAYAGEQRSYYRLQYEGREIWGATAGILLGFAKKIRAYRQACNGYYG
jgi:8-oxo-dGTP pyrophosphatase MutT (NUDIX family)